jgi:hypothetical protein
MEKIVGTDTWDQVCAMAGIDDRDAEEEMSIKVLREMMNAECYKCGQKGHYANRCQAEKIDPEAAAAARQRGEDRKKVQQNQQVAIPQNDEPLNQVRAGMNVLAEQVRMLMQYLAQGPASMNWQQGVPQAMPRQIPMNMQMGQPQQQCQNQQQLALPAPPVPQKKAPLPQPNQIAKRPQQPPFRQGNHQRRGEQPPKNQPVVQDHGNVVKALSHAMGLLCNEVSGNATETEQSSQENEELEEEEVARNISDQSKN